jgi:hypothetical protein
MRGVRAARGHSQRPEGVGRSTAREGCHWQEGTVNDKREIVILYSEQTMRTTYWNRLMVSFLHDKWRVMYECTYICTYMHMYYVIHLKQTSRFALHGSLSKQLSMRVMMNLNRVRR